MITGKEAREVADDVNGVVDREEELLNKILAEIEKKSSNGEYHLNYVYEGEIEVDSKLRRLGFKCIMEQRAYDVYMVKIRW